VTGDHRADDSPRRSIPGLAVRPILGGAHGAREGPMGKGLQRITPFLWFDRQAEEAAMLRMKKIDIAGLRKAHDAAWI
jgi:hypothetical protein